MPMRPGQRLNVGHMLWWESEPRQRWNHHEGLFKRRTQTEAFHTRALKGPESPHLSAGCCFWVVESWDLFFFMRAPQGWLANLWEVHSHVAIPSRRSTPYSALCYHGNTDTNYSHCPPPPPPACLPGRSYLTFCGFKLKNTSGSGERPSGALTSSCSFSPSPVVIVVDALRILCPDSNSVQFTGVTFAGETEDGQTRLHFIIYQDCLSGVFSAVSCPQWTWGAFMCWSVYESRKNPILGIMNSKITQTVITQPPSSPIHPHIYSTCINMCYIIGSFQIFTQIFFLVSTKLTFASSQCSI